MFFSFVKSFSLYRANFDLTKYTRQENYKRKFDLPYVLSPIVGFAATSPEGGSDAYRFATTPVSTEEFTPKKEITCFSYFRRRKRCLPFCSNFRFIPYRRLRRHFPRRRKRFLPFCNNPRFYGEIYPRRRKRCLPLQQHPFLRRNFPPKKEIICFSYFRRRKRCLPFCSNFRFVPYRRLRRHFPRRRKQCLPSCDIFPF